MQRFGHKKFELNTDGRDIVVGDIHGSFSFLEKALQEIDFDRSRDRLFALGDLVDRGPESIRAGAWLKKPWFYSVLGNHDFWQLLRYTSIDFGVPDNYLYRIGQEAEWATSTDPEKYREMLSELLKLPLAITLTSQSGPVGLIHTELPRMHPTWSGFVSSIEGKGISQMAFDHALWERYFVLRKVMCRDDSKHVVPDVKALFHGHSIPADFVPFKVANRYYIDTGACMQFNSVKQGGFTLVDIENPDTPLLSTWWPSEL